eukprot:COSAG02_NODE_2264_length_9298_cov_1444.117621_2_plen_81_part_00
MGPQPRACPPAGSEKRTDLPAPQGNGAHLTRSGSQAVRWWAAVGERIRAVFRYHSADALFSRAVSDSSTRIQVLDVVSVS